MCSSIPICFYVGILEHKREQNKIHNAESGAPKQHVVHTISSKYSNLLILGKPVYQALPIALLLLKICQMPICQEVCMH